MEKTPISMCGRCSNTKGKLPSCGLLSVGYVPTQMQNPTKYDRNEALNKGTLFPGLDLPFMNVANDSNPYAGTPLGELMALDFAIKELNLYLDTHANDEEAFMMMKSLMSLFAEGKAKYAAEYAPLTISDMASEETYTWIEGKWPWEYDDRMVTD